MMARSRQIASILCAGYCTRLTCRYLGSSKEYLGGDGWWGGGHGDGVASLEEAGDTEQEDGILFCKWAEKCKLSLTTPKKI
jgi:hypothetical protein